MSSSPFEGGEVAPARLALRNAREALSNVDVAPEAKRTAVAATFAIPLTRDLIKEAGTHHLVVVISVAGDRPYLPSISRRLRQAIFDLRLADLTCLEGADGLLFREVLV